jgi:hypothetical protein
VSRSRRRAARCLSFFIEPAAQVQSYNKYTIAPYGRVTLYQARLAAQKVFAARLEGRDPAAEKRESKRRIVADRVEDVLNTFIEQRLAQNRSGPEIARLLRREMGKAWAGRSIHRGCQTQA